MKNARLSRKAVRAAQATIESQEELRLRQGPQYKNGIIWERDPKRPGWVEAIQYKPQPLLEGYAYRPNLVTNRFSNVSDIPFSTIVDQLEQGNPESYFEALAVNPTLLLEPELYKLTIGVWWKQKDFDSEARAYLKRIGKTLAGLGSSGRTSSISPQGREAIITACKKWRPIREELNQAFKGLSQISEYKSSELYRKETRGRLAEKLDIPVEDIRAIEAFLSNPSRTARKRTPYDAMLHRVAREFLGIGENTVEKIWGNYLKAHPEKRRSRRFAA